MTLGRHLLLLYQNLCKIVQIKSREIITLLQTEGKVKVTKEVTEVDKVLAYFVFPPVDGAKKAPVMTRGRVEPFANLTMWHYLCV